MDSERRSLFEAAERALVTEASGAERPSEAKALTLVYFGGQTTKTKEVCLNVQIQGVTRTCLLDTGSEMSIFQAGLVPMGPRYGR